MSRRRLEAPALALAIGLVWAAWYPPVADLAAQSYRVWLAEQDVWLWSTSWYGGHLLPAYSVLFPPLGAAVGLRIAGLLAAIAAAAALSALVEDRRLPALWGAAGITTLLWTGRLTFALGTAFALWAAVACRRGRPRAAAAQAALAALASPVAALFVGIGAAGWWIAERPASGPPWRDALAPGPRRTAVLVTFAALAPAVALAVVFGQGGTFPFVASSFVPTLAGAVLVALVVPREQRTLRAAAWTYVAFVAVAGVVPSPVGGNAVRLGAVLAGPLVAFALWPARRGLLALVALPLVYWQWAAPVDDVRQATGDPSTREAFYAPVVELLRERQAREGPLRLELPFTDQHWDARWLAPHVSLARGWERQLDRRVNPELYDGTPLTGTGYRAWLDERGVGLVALADAPIDYSGAEAAALLRAGAVPGLRAVLRTEDWTVWEVTGTPGLATGGRVTAMRPGEVDVRVAARRPALVRVRFDAFLALVRGSGCLEKGPGGWTIVRSEAGGTVRIGARLAAGRLLSDGPRCVERPRADR